MLVLVLSGTASADNPVEADVVLRNGTVLDGGGEPAFFGHVAIADERIVAVGDFEVAGTPQIVDCTGLMVAPGFIDLHNHSDRPILAPETRANLNFITQGCTTVVTGNCGAGPTDVGEYYARIDEQGAGTNIIHLLPHGSLRDRVMGSANRPAAPDELSRMRELTRKAMQEGAWGMSTGLIYVPGTYSDTDELVALASDVGEHDGIYVSHMRNEGTELLAAVYELLEIGRRAELPVHASHFKSSGRDAWGLVRQAARMIEEARERGQIATADQYPYIASSTSLDATVIPTWARAGGREELIARFDDPEVGPGLRDEIAGKIRQKDDGAAIQFARYSKRPDWVGRRLSEVAAAEGVTPVEIAEQVARSGGASIVNFSMNEDDVRTIMQIPWVATASDGRAAIPGADKPHPRYYGTFPRKIGHYSLGEHVLPLEQAIRSASGFPADVLGLKDRGYLRSGQAADVVVFDPQQFIDSATFDEPHQYSQGVVHVYVNGVPAVVNGHPTGALAGRALRKGTGADE
jgi:N-acyl-D-aspartate/D-glutamate deacylase